MESRQNKKIKQQEINDLILANIKLRIRKIFEALSAENIDENKLKELFLELSKQLIFEEIVKDIRFFKNTEKTFFSFLWQIKSILERHEELFSVDQITFLTKLSNHYKVAMAEYANEAKECKKNYNKKQVNDILQKLGELFLKYDELAKKTHNLIKEKEKAYILEALKFLIQNGNDQISQFRGKYTKLLQDFGKQYPEFKSLTDEISSALFEILVKYRTSSAPQLSNNQTHRKILIPREAVQNAGREMLSILQQIKTGTVPSEAIKNQSKEKPIEEKAEDVSTNNIQAPSSNVETTGASHSEIAKNKIVTAVITQNESTNSKNHTLKYAMRTLPPAPRPIPSMGKIVEVSTDVAAKMNNNEQTPPPVPPRDGVTFSPPNDSRLKKTTENSEESLWAKWNTINQGSNFQPIFQPRQNRSASVVIMPETTRKYGQRQNQVEGGDGVVKPPVPPHNTKPVLPPREKWSLFATLFNKRVNEEKNVKTVNTSPTESRRAEVK